MNRTDGGGDKLDAEERAVATAGAPAAVGLTVYIALGRLDVGSAVIGGTGIVILAIILDRITQKIIKSH